VSEWVCIGKEMGLLQRVGGVVAESQWVCNSVSESGFAAESESGIVEE
jgi:hypothetical protein